MMIRGRRWLSILCALVLLISGNATVFGETKEADPLISLDVTGANVEDVLKILSQQVGTNFIASEEAQGKTITVYLDRVPATVAIAKILEANHLVALPVEGANLFMVTESKRPKIELVTKVIRLQHARVVSSTGELTSTLGFQTVSGATSAGSLSSTTGSAAAGGSSPAAPNSGLPGGAGGSAGGRTASGGIANIIGSLLSEHGSLMVDPPINALIITDLPEHFPQIEKVIAELDIRQPQVFIQAEIVEVSLDTLRRLGLEFGNDAGTVASFKGPIRNTHFPLARGLLDAKASAYTLGTLSFDEVNILFKALASQSDVKFLARPKLLALSNETAVIQITSNAATSSVTTSQATTGTITSSFERNLVGTILRVTPIVHGDHWITMVIQPEVSRITQSSKFSNALDPTSRSALTTVTVADGQAVMIAGLISRDSTDASRKVPGLGDLPIIGAPFRRTEIEDKNTEIIVFITPRVVRDDAPPPVQTPLEREQTPLSTREQRVFEGSHEWELRRRAIDNTVRIFLE